MKNDANILERCLDTVEYCYNYTNKMNVIFINNHYYWLNPCTKLHALFLIFTVSMTVRYY